MTRGSAYYIAIELQIELLEDEQKTLANHRTVRDHLHTLSERGYVVESQLKFLRKRLKER